MKDDRLRFSLDDEYARSLGRALFVFAALEWNSAHCCEKISAGYLNNLKRKTAGNISDDLIHLVQTHRPQVWALHGPACNEFKMLVVLRNRIIHGRPVTASSGDQRLSDKSEVFDISAVDAAADQFAACAIQILDMAHNHL